MNLTLGFIAFFISIVIPGILFRRFYFFGEFSKQYNTKDPVLHSIFFSIIPGVLLQLTGFLLYNYIIGYKSKFINILTIFRDFTSNTDKEVKIVTRTFINEDISTFFYYSLFVFLISAFFGLILSLVVRGSGLDKKVKLFRFKNQWYYIFSGEVLNMKKFHEVQKVKFNNNKPFKKDIYSTYADILVNVNEDIRQLYTGYLVDYDLKSEDTTKLDKIYLRDTYRYKKKKSNNKSFKEDKSQREIPGDIFILNADNIININLTYLPSNQKKIKKIKKQQKKYSTLQIINLFLFLFFIQIHFSYKFFKLDNTFLNNYFININFFGKLFTFLLITQILSFFFPNYDNSKNKYTYTSSKKEKIIKILSLIILLITCYFLVYLRLH